MEFQDSMVSVFTTLALLTPTAVLAFLVAMNIAKRESD